MKNILDYYIPITENFSVDVLDDSIKADFLVLCKYADYFNTLEKNWHMVNKSTPVSRAIAEETDRLFDIAYKSYSMVYNVSIDSYTSNFKKDVEIFIDNYKYLDGKKLHTTIKKTDEWKTFYKTYKKFNNDDFLKSYNVDGQFKNLIHQFIIVAKDFVEDVQN